MDREPEQLQFLGVYGIYKESYKITIKWRKIFTQLILTLILPLSILYLSQIQFSDILFNKINHNKHTLHDTQKGTPLYNTIHHKISSQWTTFWLLKAIYLLFLFIFSLLSTSAVVYTIASIYTSKEISFKKIVSAVPRVWIRLMLTFFWSFVIFFLYTGFTVGLIVLLAFIIIDPDEAREYLFLVLAGIFALTYLVGLVYIGAVWNLACVISVLEKIYGLKALKKSKNLIKGRIWVSSVIFVMLEISFFGILGVFSAVIMHGSSVGIFGRVVLGILCYLLMTVLIHFYLVTQTIIYFVCKSYHHENIDRSGLAEHLEACYVRLVREKDVQLEQVHV